MITHTRHRISSCALKQLFVSKKMASNISVNPYLGFKGGKCLEGMQLYQEVLGGELVKHPVKGSKMETERTKDYLMHCALQIDGKTIIMACDEMNPKAVDEVRTYEHPAVTVNINFTDETAIDRAYEMLTKDAQAIKVPLANQFWGAKFAMFVDKYGIPWMLNCELPPSEKKEEKEDSSCKGDEAPEKKARTE